MDNIASKAKSDIMFKTSGDI